jgi:hypothetical protein
VVSQTAALRAHMGRLRLLLVTKPAEVLQLARRRQNLSQLRVLAALVAAVCRTQPRVHALLTAADYDGALDVVHTAQTVLKSTLARVACLGALRRQLGEYEELIADTMSTRLLQLALHIEPPPTDAALGGAGGQAAMASAALSDAELASRTLGLVSGLARMNRLTAVLSRYRKRLMEEVRIVNKAVTLIPP